MRILHVITKLDYGGAQSVVAELATEQQRQNSQVIVVTGTLGPVADSLVAAGAVVIHLPDLTWRPDPRQDAAAIRSLVKVLRAQTPDIVHAHSSKGGLVGRLAARRSAIPAVYTAHGWPFQPGASRLQRLQSLSGELIGARLGGGEVVCVTNADLRLARRTHIAPPGRLHLVPNGAGHVAAPPPPPPVRDTFDLVMVARFTPPKRQDLAIDTVRELRARGRNVRLTLVGDASGLQAARSQAADLGDTVCFAGRADPSPFLTQAHAALLVSDYEGLPMTVIEAMRAGRPLVANRLPGIAEAITHGEHGLLTDKNPIALADALEPWIAEPSLARAAGLCAHARWRERYTAVRMAVAYDAIYRQAIHNSLSTS